MDNGADLNATIWKSDDIVRQWVSGLDERERKRLPQWQLMGELLGFDTEQEFTFLDLGAGTGAAARSILDLFPNSTAVLADFSPQMMDEGARVLERFAGRFTYVEFDMVTGDWPASIPTSLGGVVTSQCIHHIPDVRKQGLFSEILERLAPGRWYFNFDPITSEDPIVEATWRRVNARRDPSSAEEPRTPEAIARRENHERYMIPLAPQLEFMRNAGFVGIDVYWKNLDYVIYGGCRPQ